jgi:hypothetical protein
VASRFHQRFAVRHYVTLGADSDAAPSGLLFELSQGGCRVSNLGGRSFLTNESVRLHVPGFGELEGFVRKACEGVIALRYNQPLGAAVLDRLLSVCRRGIDAAAA